ncbi:MAG: phenylacetate-CoA oxygenase subunit PaaI, partial [Cellvibrionaceae bacterium]|nr:phenylacetate-CoA oxygenase subunit PaaI [Cellvibrionaceae bacterium]
CKEESFHARQGFEGMLALARGNEAQREMCQDAINRYWWPALMMFGPSDGDSPNTAQSMKWKIKRFTNDELRQKFVDQTVPQIEYLGMKVPDEGCKWNEERGHYDYSDLPWEEFYEVLKGHGPCNHERLEARRKAHDEGSWVREAALAYHQKQAEKNSQSVA